MFNIDTASAAAELPAPGAAGTPGYFTNGDPTAGTPPTTISADWLNGIQAELLSILSAASIEPNKTEFNQVLTALRDIFMPINGGFGVGYAWFNETGSRVSGTTYTNTEAGPIAVLVAFPDTSGSSPEISVTVGGTTIINAFLYDTSTSAASAIASFLVPPGATYSVYWPTGESYSSPGAVQWSEMRLNATG
ncbi:hypothetical protein [Novosphingobium sp. FSW06-99]|uniref:hypothetical protein n=1 Tax=Novosphingobium sp. FSW06-99 TaxID=1739113 RepID=UPI00076C3054|nr:hypothetical protein [Novosphingobium sp. FSW06-99]KUR80749.1 hypothetical protein AQZ49_01600 [Novosphingobium sp. FSW06-99]